MGQIVSSAAKPKRCNANQLSQVPTPAAGEHILVSSDNSMNAEGQGNFDAYIVGDGTTAAAALPLHYLADEEPVAGSKNGIMSAWAHKFVKPITDKLLEETQEILDLTSSAVTSAGFYYDASLEKVEAISNYIATEVDVTGMDGGTISFLAYYPNDTAKMGFVLAGGALADVQSIGRTDYQKSLTIPANAVKLRFNWTNYFDSQYTQKIEVRKTNYVVKDIVTDAELSTAINSVEQEITDLTHAISKKETGVLDPSKADGVLANHYVTASSVVKPYSGLSIWYKYFADDTPASYSTSYFASSVCISSVPPVEDESPTEHLCYGTGKTGEFTIPAGSYLWWSCDTPHPENTAVSVQMYGDIIDFSQFATKEEIDNIPINEDLPKRYLVDGTTPKPLLAEMMADFAWCSMIEPAVLSGKNVVLIISGNQGSSEVTASSISPDGLSISDIGTDWVGGVISPDGINYSVCNFRYKSGSTIEIFPALQENITNGTLSTLMFDSGTTHSGMHLTENGYKAYMQNLYGKNPKHCEVGKYIARFRADIDETCPFTWYGGQIYGEQYRFTTENMYSYWLNRPSSRAYCYKFSTSFTPHTTKSGAYWEVDLGGKSGYLEAFVFPIAQGILSLPSDQYIHVEVTIDGELAYSSILTDTICKRICVDYNNASTGKIEIYSNKWAGVEGQAYGFGLGRVTWWVNELDYPDNVLFPKGAVIAEEFDSWGVFHDEASAKELERLHNEMTGVTVPFTNNSKGSQTSAWGMAWFYENVWKYNPSICIQDFGINDTNSIPSSLPETVEGPDGKLYNNRLTQEQYCANMITLGKLATYNGIQPIFMRNCQHGPSAYYVFSNALVDALSEEVV